MRDVPLEGAEDFVRSSRVLEVGERITEGLRIRRLETPLEGSLEGRGYKGNSKYRAIREIPDKARC